MDKLKPSDRQKIALYLRISPKMAELLVRMFNQTVLTYEEIERDRLCKAHRRFIERLRAVVSPWGVVVNTMRGEGYWIDNTSREALLEVIRGAEKLTAGGNR